MAKEYIEREAALSAQNKSMNLAECRKRLERLPASDVVERPEWITAEHLQEIFKADREGRLRIAARPIEETCGSCRWFEREPGTASGRCTRRTKRYRGWLDSGATMHVFQSRKACRSDYEKRDEGC